MSFERWQHEAEREKTVPGGHIGPIDEGWEEQVAVLEKWAREKGWLPVTETS